MADFELSLTISNLGRRLDHPRKRMPWPEGRFVEESWMRIRPEARQRLEHGFQRRIDQQKRRFAMQWRNAIEFGRRSGLGQAVGIFRTELHPPLRFLCPVRLMAPLVAIPVLIMAAVKGVPGMSRLLFFAPFLFGGWIGVNSLLAWRNRYYRWLFAYAGGFTEFDESDQPDRPTRWDDFTDVADSWTWTESEVSSNSWTFDGLQLTVRGGTSILFNTPYKNMLDPYHPVNRMLAALLPSTVASIIPQFPTIIEIFTTHLIRRNLDRDLATVHAGGIVERAGIHVTRDGLTFPGQTSMTPWVAIRRIDLTPDRARIQFNAGGRTTTHPVMASSGPWVLSLLLNQLPVQASFNTSI
jgi:hypothetical protein